LIGKILNPDCTIFFFRVGGVLIWLQDRSGILEYDWIKEMKCTSVGCKGTIAIAVIMAVISSG